MIHLFDVCGLCTLEHLQWMDVYKTIGILYCQSVHNNITFAQKDK